MEDQHDTTSDSENEEDELKGGLEDQEDEGEGRCTITYLKGDATLPQAKGVKLIVHINNTYGGWGKGFASALTSRCGKEPAKEFRKWHKERNTNDFRLGAVQFIQLDTYVWLGNMVAQQGLGGKTARHKAKPQKGASKQTTTNEEGKGAVVGGGNVKVQYAALGECLQAVRKKALALGASVHMPRIGTGLGGGKWETIEGLISKNMKGLAVFVYDT